MSTPARARYAKIPNPTKHVRSNLKTPATTPRKRLRSVKNIDDEEIPDGFSRINKDFEDITPLRADYRTEEAEYRSVEMLKYNQSDEQTPAPKELSDSNNSSTSTDRGDITIVNKFDTLMACYESDIDDLEQIEDCLAEFVGKQVDIHTLYQKSLEECKRFQEELDKANRDIGDLSNKLNHARKLLDKEKKCRWIAEEERNSLEKQMALAGDLLFGDQYKMKLPDDTREKLAFLKNTSSRYSTSQQGNGMMNGRLNTISEVNSTEINTTGSLLSDFSFSRSEDNLDTSIIHSGRPLKYVQDKFKPTSSTNEPSNKKRRSSGNCVEINNTDKIVATTTVQISKDGPITATSIIESVPQEPVPPPPSQTEARRQSLQEIPLPNTPVYTFERQWPSSARLAGNNNENCIGPKQHNFVPKAMVRPEHCGPCNKRIRFGKIATKCRDCKSICHNDCRAKLPLPCIPQVNTPTQKGVITIADYAPTTHPMVPAIIVHCVNEVELRGLNEIGLYRVPGSERDVKQLKERFLRGKGSPSLTDIDVHVICGVIKDFLRSLHEPLITQALWSEFVSVSDLREIAKVPPILYGAISKLPNANRDTLAFMILHLQRVSQSPDCKMPIGNLAKVFGPTIIGYSSNEPDPRMIFTETGQQAVVMEYLLSLPSDFWGQYVNICTPVKTGTLHQTPSTDSLLRTNGNKGFFNTPYGIRSAQPKRRPAKFFGTPPHK